MKQPAVTQLTPLPMESPWQLHDDDLSRIVDRRHDEG